MRIVKIILAATCIVAAFFIGKSWPISPIQTTDYIGNNAVITATLWRMPRTEAHEAELQFWMTMKCRWHKGTLTSSEIIGPRGGPFLFGKVRVQCSG